MFCRVCAPGERTEMAAETLVACGLKSLHTAVASGVRHLEIDSFWERPFLC